MLVALAFMCLRGALAAPSSAVVQADFDAVTFETFPSSMIEGGSSPPYFLFVVPSKPEDGDRRQLIRETWASTKDIDGRQLRVVFLIGQRGVATQRAEGGRARSIEAGKTRNPVNGEATFDAVVEGGLVQDDVDDEANVFGDILRGKI